MKVRISVVLERGNTESLANHAFQTAQPQIMETTQ
jgi:hypothetical protein